MAQSVCFRIAVDAGHATLATQAVLDQNSRSMYRERMQHEVRSAAALLERGVLDRVFPGAAYAVTCGETIIASATVGRFTYDETAPSVTPATIYDVASLTKVLATTAMAMTLFERGLLDLETPLASILPPFANDNADPRRANVTLRMLLTHSSGLPAYVKLFETANDRDSLLAAAFAVPLEATPGTRAEYSDIGFILLGVALEKIAGQSIDSFCRTYVFDALRMSDTLFCPPASLHHRIPPTEHDQALRHRVVRGEVHDENAWTMGGVAGHAGLFASAEDVAKFAMSMLRGGSPLFRAETVDMFTRRQPSPPGTTRALGWDTRSEPSSSGRYLSPRSFGHLGFTGTSLWIDPERQLSITLLSNRTWPNRGQQDAIRRLRPAFHDAVVEDLALR